MIQASLDGEMHDGRHVMAVRVYYEDTDFTGIVYHANYLRYMERGRTNYLRLIGADHRALFEQTEKEAPSFAFVVRSMKIDFLKPAFMDDLLEVRTLSSISVLPNPPATRHKCRSSIRARTSEETRPGHLQGTCRPPDRRRPCDAGARLLRGH